MDEVRFTKRIIFLKLNCSLGIVSDGRRPSSISAAPAYVQVQFCQENESGIMLVVRSIYLNPPLTPNECCLPKAPQPLGKVVPSILMSPRLILIQARLAGTLQLLDIPFLDTKLSW